MDNIFIKPVYDSRIKGASNKKLKEFMAFCKQLKTVSPQFDELWQIAEFIKVMEDSFFYENKSDSTDKSVLYSSRQYNPRENGFCIHTSEANIKYKLFERDHSIHLDINSLVGNKLSKSYVFDGSDQFLTYVDEMLLDTVMDLTMGMVIDLMKTYYKYPKRPWWKCIIQKIRGSAN